MHTTPTNKQDTRHRYREIASSLARHGLGFLGQALGVSAMLPFNRGWLGHPVRLEPYTQPEHVRLAMQDLGTTFIKLGQILSTRPDLVNEEYQREFARLQDNVPPIDSEIVRGVVESELGSSTSELFGRFDPNPIASASIGQAHAATLHDGSDVVVKVRKPGTVARVEEDLDILAKLSHVASRRVQEARDFDIIALAADFSQTLRNELDYRREAANIHRLREAFADDPSIRIPKVYENLTTSRVLTMERFEGLSPAHLGNAHLSAEAARGISERLARFMLVSVFENGFFHADPHPGNFFFLEDGTIGVIDFGMIGELSPAIRLKLAALFIAIEQRDAERLTDIFLDVTNSARPVERTALSHDLELLVQKYFGASFAALNMGALLGELLGAVRKHRLRLPGNLALLFKAWIMVEGLVTLIDPTANTAQFLEPYIKQLMLRRLGPGDWLPRLQQAGIDVADLSVDLPRRLDRVLSSVERGSLRVWVSPTDFSEILDRMEAIAKRGNIATIVASFIVGLAILMAVYHPAAWRWWAAFAFSFGFATATLLGGYLIWLTLRGTRR